MSTWSLSQLGVHRVTGDVPVLHVIRRVFNAVGVWVDNDVQQTASTT